ncbi:MAG: hypothetical protein QM758_15680 [Armatimonas sp.]
MASESLRRDRELRHLYYRPYVLAGGMFVLITLGVSVLAGSMWLRREKEWEGVPIQQVEATCLRSYPMSTSGPLLISERWVNTYLMNNQERTMSRPESCMVGKPYRLNYRLAKSGRFMVIAQKAVVSLPGR